MSAEHEFTRQTTRQNASNPEASRAQRAAPPQAQPFARSARAAEAELSLTRLIQRARAEQDNLTDFGLMYRNCAGRLDAHIKAIQENKEDPEFPLAYIFPELSVPRMTLQVNPAPPSAPAAALPAPARVRNPEESKYSP